MSDKQKKKGEINIDLGFGNLFKGMGNFIDLVSELAEKGESIIEKSGEFTGEGKLKDLKGVYGFSVRTGVGGSPKVEHFGNIKQTEKGPIVDEIREPIIDVFDEEGYIRILAELPGVAENDIKAALKGDILTIQAENKDRKYNKEILLDSPVKADSLSKLFKNGILEVKLTKID